MANLLKAKLRDKVSSSARMSCDFVERLIPESPHWVLGACHSGSGSWEWRTFHGEGRRVFAERWILAAYQRGAEVWMCVGDVTEPLAREPTDRDIVCVRVVAAHARDINGFLDRQARAPHLAYNSLSGRAIAVWRLSEPVSPADAQRQSGIFAAGCCKGSFSALPISRCIPVAPDLYPLDYYHGCMGRIAFRAPAYAPISSPSRALPSPGGKIIDVEAHPVAAEDLDKSKRIVEEFGYLHVNGRIAGVHTGPVVTTYTFVPAQGVRIGAVLRLEEDIAMRLGEESVRIAKPPKAVGLSVEIPNKTRQMVPLDVILKHEKFRNFSGFLPMALGVDTLGEPVIKELEIHKLISGTTGSGKSVGVSADIISLISSRTPEQCRLLLIDPKKTEFSIYAGIPHLLTPVVTTQEEAAASLKWLLAETMRRYDVFEKVRGVRNLTEYNAQVDEPIRKLPFIVAFIDELADLLTVIGDKNSPEAEWAADISAATQKLAQISRAAGVFMVVSMQRPSGDIIKGAIKANFPTRQAFQAASGVDSEVMLGSGNRGAESLLGLGDGLLLEKGGRISRFHGAFIDARRILEIVDALIASGSPEYVDMGEADDDGGSDSGESDKHGSGTSGSSKRPLDDVLREALATGPKTRSELFRVACDHRYRSQGSLTKALMRIGAQSDGKDGFGGTTTWRLPP